MRCGRHLCPDEAGVLVGAGGVQPRVCPRLSRALCPFPMPNILCWHLGSAIRHLLAPLYARKRGWLKRPQHFKHPVSSSVTLSHGSGQPWVLPPAKCPLHQYCGLK